MNSPRPDNHLCCSQMPQESRLKMTCKSFLQARHQSATGWQENLVQDCCLLKSRKPWRTPVMVHLRLIRYGPRPRKTATPGLASQPTQRRLHNNFFLKESNLLHYAATSSLLSDAGNGGGGGSFCGTKGIPRSIFARGGPFSRVTSPASPLSE